MIPINTIHGGEATERAIFYRPPSQTLYNYLQDNYHNAMQYVRDVGGSFVNNVKNLYNKYTSDDAIQRVKETLFRSGVHFSQNVIHEIQYNQLNQANLTMQRYMMAHPQLGDLHRRSMVNGFSETLYDMEPEVYGSDRLDYGRAMDGVLQFDKDESGYVEYFIQDDSVLDETPLSDMEQFAIADMYDLVTMAIMNGLDPTDPEYMIEE